MVGMILYLIPGQQASKNGIIEAMDTKGTSGKLREVAHDVDLCVVGGGIGGLLTAAQV